MIYTPKNTRFNRQCSFIGKSVQLLMKKNGLVYFLVYAQDEELFCYCEESLFFNEFEMAENESSSAEPARIRDINKLSGLNIHYKRYPVELTRK